MENRRTTSRTQRTDWLFIAFHPLYWRTRIRRLFLATAPVAIPLWALIVCALLVGAILRPVGATLVKLWNGKTRHRYAYSYYSYDR